MMWLTMLVVLAAAAADQASKWWALHVLAPAGSMPLLPGVMRLRYVLNDGAAFSMLAGQQPLLIAATSVAMAVLLALLLFTKRMNGGCHWGMALIVGGGLGNLIDRLLDGRVVDFFELEFIDFAVFNVADSFVTIGCILLILGILCSGRPADKSKKDKRDGQPRKRADGKVVFKAGAGQTAVPADADAVQPAARTSARAAGAAVKAAEKEPADAD